MGNETVTNLRIKKSLDSKIGDIAHISGKTKTKLYEEAVKEYIDRYNQNAMYEDGKIENLLNEKLGNIDKHLSSMIGQLWKEMGLLYTTNILSLQKTLEVLDYDTKTKYTDTELMKVVESRSDAVYNHLVQRAKANKKEKSCL